jgi:indolepyruvate ferredoxin oxidoreductase alpha subunit
MKNKLSFWDIAKEFCNINGFNVISNYPGSNSSAIIDDNPYHNYGISFNEKIAYEVAYGSSLSDSRSVVSLKNVGLNVASDSYLNSLLTGTKKAMLVFVVDDVWVYSSQSLQDSRHYLDFYNSPCIEPRDIKDSVQILSDATRLSEKIKIPVMIRLTNNFLEQSTNVEILNSIEPINETPNSRLRKEYFLTHPKNSKIQREYLKKRISDLESENNNSELNYFDNKSQKSKNLDILFGASESKTNNDKLIIQSYPIPIKKICDRLKLYDSINVYDQGQSYGFEKLKENFNLNFKSYVSEIPDNTKRVFFTNKYENIFSKIKSLNEKTIFGDLNFFSNESTNVYDSILCLGGSIGNAIGSKLSGNKNVFAILGDGGLRHSAILALREAVSKGININIIIIDNGGSKSTGMHRFSIPVENLLCDLEYIKSDFKELSSEKINDIINGLTKNKKTKVWLIEDKEN